MRTNDEGAFVLKDAESSFTHMDKNGQETQLPYKVSGSDFYKLSDGPIAMPIGTYAIQEVKAPEGYRLDPTVRVRHITDADHDGEIIETYDAEENGDLVTDQVVRSDLRFMKRAEGAAKLAGIPFKLTSKTTGEWHIIVTDKNGLASTESTAAHPHDQRTNSNDEQFRAPDGSFRRPPTLDVDALDPTAGTWFGLRADGTAIDPDNEHGALPFDTYELEELRCPANAIFQNLSFIEAYDPEYVLILSGDHVYKMDYADLLRRHKEAGAACTIAVLEVPMEEASRFGIMNVDENDDIYEFEEKPKKPKSNLASMGVYIFTWSALKQYLIDDEADPKSENDFGKNIIPAFLRDGRPMFAYAFEGYWKDVGTLESLWDANMDLLDPTDPINMRDSSFRVYARNYASPATRIDPGARVTNSFVAEGCIIRGTVEHSVLYTDCEVEEGAIITGAVIMPNTRVCKGANVSYAIVGEGCVIEEGVKIGERPENCPNEDWGITVVGHKKTLPAGSVIKPKEIV